MHLVDHILRLAMYKRYLMDRRNRLDVLLFLSDDQCTILTNILANNLLYNQDPMLPMLLMMFV